MTSALNTIRTLGVIALGTLATTGCAAHRNHHHHPHHEEVGGENVVKVYRRDDEPELVATIPTGDLPHGIWGSGDGARVYVGLGNQDAVAAIDTTAAKPLRSA